MREFRKHLLLRPRVPSSSWMKDFNRLEGRKKKNGRTKEYFFQFFRYENIWEFKDGSILHAQIPRRQCTLFNGFPWKLKSVKKVPVVCNVLQEESFSFFFSGVFGERRRNDLWARVCDWWLKRWYWVENIALDLPTSTWNDLFYDLEYLRLYIKKANYLLRIATHSLRWLT